jgi:hypothetical protein
MSIQTYGEWYAAYERLKPLCARDSGYGEKLGELQRYSSEVFFECADMIDVYKLAKFNRILNSLEKIIFYENLKG